MLLRFNLFSMSAMQQPFRVFERCLETLQMLETFKTSNESGL